MEIKCPSCGFKYDYHGMGVYSTLCKKCNAVIKLAKFYDKNGGRQ